jgi:hypothetical protein
MSKQRSNRFKPSVEALDDRLVPTVNVVSGELVITGTDARDVVTVVGFSEYYSVYENGRYINVPTGRVYEGGHGGIRDATGKGFRGVPVAVAIRHQVPHPGPPAQLLQPVAERLRLEAAPVLRGPEEARTGDLRPPLHRPPDAPGQDQEPGLPLVGGLVVLQRDHPVPAGVHHLGRQPERLPRPAPGGPQHRQDFRRLRLGVP